MTSRIERPSHVSQEDWSSIDVPELTDEQLAQTRPLAEVLPEMAAALRNRGGRPRLDRPKVKVAWRLSADVVDAVQATGTGYNGRVDAILRQAIADGKL